MEPGAIDPRWPRLLSLAVHELRTPMTVVAGYIRMLLKDRAGPLAEQQRRLLSEAEKSCTRVSALLVEMSELGTLENGSAAFNRSRVDLHAVLSEAIAALPEVPEREIPVDLIFGDAPAFVHGDPVRLQTAFTSLLNGLRRELVSSPRLLVRAAVRPHGQGTAAWIAIAGEDQVDAVQSTPPTDLTSFDEWRGGSGLSLPIARRVFTAHGGALWSPADGAKAAAIVVMPLTS